MNPCPCGSQKPLEACCRPYIEGLENAPTAESLMRSRFTAYSLANVDYILDTCHPSILKQQDPIALQRWCETSQFLRLELIETKQGGLEDEQGFVRFIAWIKEKDVLGGIHERSTFTRFEDRWTYLSGQHFTLKMPGPNDPCPCGSGQKFKKCCGA
jgi:SEC-C motif domain protein